MRIKWWNKATGVPRLHPSSGIWMYRERVRRDGKGREVEGKRFENVDIDVVLRWNDQGTDPSAELLEGKFLEIGPSCSG